MHVRRVKTAIRRWGIVFIVVVLAALGASLFSDTFSRLGSGGLTSESAESARAAALLKERFSQANPDIYLLIDAHPEQAATAAGVVDKVAQIAGVETVHSYFTDLPMSQFRAADGSGGLAFITVDAAHQRPSDIVDIADRAVAVGRNSGISVRAAGEGVIDGQIDDIAEQSLVRAELIAAPLVALILLVVFGSVWAALMPVLAGGLSVAVSLFMLNMITRLTDVSTFAVNLATAIGFGLAVDYSLFVIARFREARAAGLSPDDARRLCLRTSGRTIVFSGVTVVLSMVALLLFPGYFLKSLAYSGIITVLAVMVITLTVVPLALVLLGDRILKRYRWSSWAAVEYVKNDRDNQATGRAPGRIKSAVVVGILTVILLAVAAPFINANFILRDYRELPSDNSARVATEIMAAKYPELATSNTVSIVVPSSHSVDSLRVMRDELMHVPGVTSVSGLLGTEARGSNGALQTSPATVLDRVLFSSPDGDTWMRVGLGVDAESRQARDIVTAIRAITVPAHALVSGETPSLMDSIDGIVAKLPYAAVLIIVATALLLFLLTGSVILPIVGVALSVLSLGATFGAMVVIFQDGHLADLLGGFTAYGAINVTAPILMFCIAYGLSMDYQMFILSRIAEEHEHGSSTEGSIRVGISATRRVIGAAAVLIAVVLAAMATSGLTYLKILGVGLAIAVIVDAFIVRLFLLPNVMRVLGVWCWYRPTFLDRIYRVFRLSHGDESTGPSITDTSTTTEGAHRTL